jgi:hypothetical protein
MFDLRSDIQPFEDSLGGCGDIETTGESGGGECAVLLARRRRGRRAGRDTTMIPVHISAMDQTSSLGQQKYRENGICPLTERNERSVHEGCEPANADCNGNQSQPECCAKSKDLAPRKLQLAKKWKRKSQYQEVGADVHDPISNKKLVAPETAMAGGLPIPTDIRSAPEHGQKQYGE